MSTVKQMLHRKSKGGQVF